MKVLHLGCDIHKGKISCKIPENFVRSKNSDYMVIVGISMKKFLPINRDIFFVNNRNFYY